MEAWQEKRSVHTMNLRSVFTSEQQRILERYYDNGMTNQSKSCFQLILQCAQEAKLDFSVVRTWVGNKRRKLASKADKNGVAGLSTHAIVSSGAPLVAGPLLTGIQRGPAVTHLLPHPSSCPSSSSSSSSSSSPSSNSANNNDVIVTGSYSLPRNPNRQDAPSQNRSSASASPSLPAKVLLLNPDPESGLHSRLVPNMDVASLQRKSPQIPVSSALMFNQIRGTLSPKDLATAPPSWAKQYRPPQHQPWPTTSHRPASANQQRAPPDSPAESGVRIQQVFTIAGLTDAPQWTNSSPVQEQRKVYPFETAETFSIAMETGDTDEYSREEELANMGAQLQLSKPAGGGVNEGPKSSTESYLINRQGAYIRTQPPVAQNTPNTAPGEKRCQTNRARVEEALHESAAVRAFSESSRSGALNHKVTVTAAPWLVSNSRKRTLQDRTQFSDGDLLTLKRYWDKGMTSLGSVCREKISAASTELNVDPEIVKTWIGNRRRKYRLMGIEIPPPKGGPATFPKVMGAEPPPSSTPEQDGLKTSEQNDTVLLCLSEDGESDSNLKENNDHGGVNSFDHDDSLKIEIIDEDEDDDDVMVTTDLEQMQNLLEYKHEEVQYLESELVRQKQKYHELRTFTRSLLIALKNNDMAKQQEILSTLPHHLEDNLIENPEQDAEPNGQMKQKDSSVSEGEEAAEPMGQ